MWLKWMASIGSRRSFRIVDYIADVIQMQHKLKKWFEAKAEKLMEFLK